MDLNEMLVFTRVVQAGSFTAAARALDMPKSSVSRKVSDLEDRLGVAPAPAHPASSASPTQAGSTSSAAPASSPRPRRRTTR